MISLHPVEEAAPLTFEYRLVGDPAKMPDFFRAVKMLSDALAAIPPFAGLIVTSMTRVGPGFYRLSVVSVRSPFFRALALAGGFYVTQDDVNQKERLRDARIAIVNKLHQWRQDGRITDEMAREMGPALDSLVRIAEEM